MASKLFLALIATLFISKLQAKDLEIEPWGTDSELVSFEIQNNKSLSQTTISKSGAAGFDSIILFHQKIISPSDGPRSHFYPSSSQYMLDAVRKHGFFTGFSLGCDRLLRENNEKWVYPVITTKDGHGLKWDPVPNLIK